MSAVTHAARANRIYMRATTNAHSTRSSSLMVETAESTITAKLKVIEKRCHKGLYSARLRRDLVQRLLVTKMKKS
jgi:hypothetical protein